MKKERPILITGCPRSGASMIAGILELCGGIYVGDVSTPEKKSFRGMKENKTLFEKIVEPYFQAMKVCPAGQFPLPDVDKLLIPRNLHDEVLLRLQEEGYSFESPWMYKSNKLALTWPNWNYAFPEARWLIVRRRTGDIVSSCLDTGYMAAFQNQDNRKKIGAETEADAWKWWVHQYETRFVEMIQAGVNVKVIWPDRMVEGNYHQLYETIEWLGLKWTSSILNKVLEYVDPKFWKVRRGRHG